MTNARLQRRAVSLLELLAVVTLMGIFGSIAMMRFGRSIFGDFGAVADARKIGLGLLHAKRTAIFTGDPHAVRFIPSLDGTQAIGGFELVRLNDSLQTLGVADGPFYFTPAVQITSSQNDVVFNFEGQAQQAVTIDLRGDHQHWQIQVMPVNGTVTTTKIP